MKYLIAKYLEIRLFLIYLFVYLLLTSETIQLGS